MTGGWPLTSQTVPHSQLAAALLFAWDLHCALRLHSLSCDNYNVAKFYLGFFWLKLSSQFLQLEIAARK